MPATGPWCVFEDPDLDSRAANVVWRSNRCHHVLPLVASRQHFRGDRGQFSIDGLKCRVTTLRDDKRDRLCVLFAQEGRSLQLEICNASSLEDGTLMISALPQLGIRSARSLAMQRLADLMAKKSLRAPLYRPYRRAKRLAEVVQALDASQAGASYREIALALFGPARVARDWHYPNNHLREHVRRTVGYGLKLIDGGYTRFLQ